MFVVDASTLVIAADRSDPHHDRCRDQVLEWRRQPTPWYLTWPIVFEYLRIVTHPKLLCRPWPLPEAWTFIEAVLAAPALTVLCTGPHHQSIIQQLTETLPDLRGEQMHETAIIATMIEHGIRRIVTRDIEYHRFPMIEVLDPLRTPA